LIDHRDYGQDDKEKNHFSGMTTGSNKQRSRKTREEISRPTQNDDVRENQTRKRGQKAQRKKNKRGK
jgi:hypothetical protein